MALTHDGALTFVQNLAPTWVKQQQTLLTYLLCALERHPSLRPPSWPAPLPDSPHASSRQTLHGRLKRLNRFLDNLRLDELVTRL